MHLINYIKVRVSSIINLAVSFSYPQFKKKLKVTKNRKYNNSLLTEKHWLIFNLSDSAAWNSILKGKSIKMRPTC